VTRRCRAIAGVSCMPANANTGVLSGPQRGRARRAASENARKGGPERTREGEAHRRIMPERRGTNGSTRQRRPKIKREATRASPL